MLNRFWRPVAVAVLVLALAAAGGSAAAKTAKPKRNATLEMKGKLTLKRNKFLRDGAHFSPGVVAIRSGGTLTLRNRQEAPHTFSVVRRSEVPRTPGKMLNCGAPGTACDKVFTAHQPDADGNPTVPFADVGTAGIDQAGDSVFLNPKQNVKVNVSAPKGRTLHFFCAIHAWMQGQLRSR